MKLASFDIFDTTLIRRCGSPSALFELLAKELYPHDTSMSEAFLLWRSQAEKNVAAHIRGKETTLSDIYAELPLDSFKGYDLQEFMAAERAMEARQLIANPAIRTIISNKRQEGWQIVFISDMYLDSQLLREVLVREGCAEATDPIYVSCEYDARKDTGALYQKVRKKFQPSEWEHYGDNAQSDVKMARRHGIKAFAVNTSCNPAEKYILQAGEAFPKRSRWSLLPAFSRTARLTGGNSPYDAMAADFVAPTYIPYVLSTFHSARQMGLKRLYFLSRDSYILMRIAEVFAEDFPEIELRYLFVSRRTLLLPYLFGGDEGDYLSAADHQTIVRQGTVDGRLNQLGTNREEMQQSFNITFPYHRISNKKEEKDFLQKIFHSNYTSVLQERALQQYSLFIDYLAQEKVTDGSPCGMVDVGWLGTTRLMMNHILRREGCKQVHFFYFGIRGDALPPSTGSYTTYNRYGELSTEATALIENYFSASPYPTTIGYQRNREGNITPLFPEGEEYEENPIIKANKQMAVTMAKAIREMDINSKELLFAWSKISLRVLTETNIKVNLAPLATCSKFDAMPFVKRLGAKELFKLVFLGDHTTAFDKASIKLSLPKILWNPAWKLHQQIEKIRMVLYYKCVTKN